MTFPNRKIRSLSLFIFLFLIAIGPIQQRAHGDDVAQRWVTTWTTANAASEHPLTISNQTIREIVHTTIGGSKVRVRLSNTFATRAIRFDAVFVGIGGLQEPAAEKRGATLSPGSNHEVTFGGSRSITIPEGAEALSDPVSLAVAPEQNLAISLFVAPGAGRQRSMEAPAKPITFPPREILRPVKMAAHSRPVRDQRPRNRGTSSARSKFSRLPVRRVRWLR